MTSLIHLIYASQARMPVGLQDLEQIVTTSRRNNPKAGITGRLLFSEGSFFQVLEGPAESVDGAYGRISGDSRHSDVVTIIREPLVTRHFPDWSMGFFEASPAEVAGVTDLDQGAEPDISFEHITPGRARKLLDAFRRGRWHSTV